MRKAVLFCIMGFLVSCLAKEKDILSISQEDFKTLYQQDTTIQLVDVRTQVEFEKGHISRAILIDVKQDGFLANAKEKLNKNIPVYIYCRSGVRSKKAAEVLVSSKEFDQIYYITGGYLEWSNK